MATKKKPTAEETNKALAISDEPGALVTYDYGKHAGGGTDNMDASDMAIPFIAVLQSNSPEVDGSKGKERQIPGAQAGMFMDTVSREITDGEEGFVFIPCATSHEFVEWIKRTEGGGFVDRHDLHSPFVAECQAKAKAAGLAFNKVETPSGHMLTETFYVPGLILNDANDTVPIGFAIIAFTSTKIKPYKVGIGELNKFKAGMPLYGHRLRVTTVPDQNKKGAFRNICLLPALGDDSMTPRQKRAASAIPPELDGQEHPLLIAGHELAKSFLSGTANVAWDSQAAGEGSGEGNDEAF